MQKYLVPLLCIIVLLVVYFYTRSVTYDELLGVFVTPESFAKENGVSSIIVMIVDVTTLGSFSGFIVIDESTIPFDGSIPLWSKGLDHIPVTMKYEDGIDILPEEMIMTVSHGHLVLEDDDNVYVAAQWVPIF